VTTDVKAGRILVVRHGESAANAGARTNDPALIPLTEVGARQARIVADMISERPSLIVVSRFLRTLQTATPLIERYPGVPVESWPVEEFTYLDIGACTGTTYAEREGLRDTYWARCDPLWADGPGCESFASFIARVRTLEHALSARDAERAVVVYTHGLLIQALLWLRRPASGDTSRAAMQDFDRFRRSVPVPNCAMFRAATDDSGRLRLSPNMNVNA